jgi:hypothetical protein
MSKAVIELMLGNTGRFLLAVYDDYHFFINAIVILYGLLLIWAHMDLRRWVHRMEKNILDLAQKSGSPPDPQVVHEAFLGAWKISQDHRKIIIPSRNDLWFSKVGAGELAEILGIQPDYIRVVLTKAGGLVPVGTVSKKTYRVWESYRHQLLIGIRARYMEPETQFNMRKNKALSKTNPSGRS